MCLGKLDALSLHGTAKRMCATSWEQESSFSRFVKTYRSGVLIGILVTEMIISPGGGLPPAPRSAAGSCRSYCRSSRPPATWRTGKSSRAVVLPIAAVWLVARLLEAFGNRQHADARAGSRSRSGVIVRRAVGNFRSRALSPADHRHHHRRSLHRLPDHGDGIRPALLDPQPGAGQAV